MQTSHRTRLSVAGHLFRMIFCLSILPFLVFCQDKRKEGNVEHPTRYRTIQVDGLSIFYREAGPTFWCPTHRLGDSPLASQARSIS
jgi:hypothetical protein